ncbi:MAG: hypothetical protein SPH68_07905 [Candidatus Borkfalkiaceae bacterium]|nr:hypothetical protein [Clostridia bacterium]MDY6224064.1 hypothetical protein [Christensenellaceae bacterium]
MARKMTKQEKLLEKEREKRKKRIVKEKDKQYDGGFLARCVAILIGFVLGIFGTLGGIAGGGYYLVTQKTIRETASLAGGFDITQYLAEEYADKTIKDFVISIGEIGAKFTGGEASLATVAEISPYANTLTDTLASYLSDFGLDIDVEEFKTTAFSAYGEFLQNSLQKTRLAGLIGAEPDTTLMGLLCFGEEGVDYIKNADGTLNWLGDSHELVVGDFMDNGATSDLFNRLSLKAVMETTGSVNLNDSITRALVYGTKNIDYKVETVAGEERITMLPFVYSFENDGSGTKTLKDDHGDVVDAALYFNDAESGVLTLYKAVPAEGETPEVSAYLKQDGEDGKYYAYKTAEDAAAGAKDTRILHKATALGDLLKGDFESIFQDLELADLLNVTPSSDGALLALAYGNKGDDYTVTDGKIVMLGDAKPRTIKDLKGDASLFSDLRLADVLKISPSDANETMVILAYGKEGKNYTLVGDDINWLPKEYVEKKKTGESNYTLFDDNGNEVSGAVKDAANNVWTWTVGSGEESKTYNAKAIVSPGDVKGTHTFYVYEVIDGVTSDSPVKFAPRTINDLKTLDTQELIGGMTLESLLKIDVNSSDAVLTALAYGKEGVTYTVTDGVVSMNNIVYSYDGGAWKDENGKVIDTALYTDLGGGVFEFLRAENGVSYYAYATGVSAAGDYTLYDVQNNPLQYAKRSVSALKSANAVEAFNDVELKHVIPENINDKINLYLLYGKENEGYKIEDEKVVLLAAPHTIGDLRASGENSILSKMREELTIGDILGDVSGNKILKKLSQSTLNSLSTDINNLKITEVFESDIYRVDELTGEFILDAENKKIMKTEWKYLLTDPETDATGNYTIQNFSKLTENMTGNIKKTNLKTLERDFSLGINDSFIDLQLNAYALNLAGLYGTGDGQFTESDTIGDMTLQTLSTYIVALASMIP